MEKVAGPDKNSQFTDMLKHQASEDMGSLQNRAVPSEFCPARITLNTF